MNTTHLLPQQAGLTIVEATPLAMPMEPESYSSDEWTTPEWLTTALGTFDLDPCSNPRSTVQARSTYSLEQGLDGLSLPWTGSVFCNPPYSAPRPWCDRLGSYSSPWVALLKLDPSTRWWAALLTSPRTWPIWWAPFRKRVRFQRPDKPPLTANFPSVLVWSNWRAPNELRSHLWPPNVA